MKENKLTLKKLIKQLDGIYNQQQNEDIINNLDETIKNHEKCTKLLDDCDNIIIECENKLNNKINYENEDVDINRDLERLETINELLEDDKIGLEKSVKLYLEGKRLTDKINNYLAKQKLNLIEEI